jgi:MFS transporter, PAT family, beta-lactamase induction signal transducer AmpG
MLSIYFHRPLLILLALGFVSGVPFLLTLSTLSFWLTEIRVSKSIIGLFMLASLPYSLKFLWSPFIDSFSIPYLTKFFSRRKSWSLLAQAGILISIMALGLSNPAKNLYLTGIFAFLVSFFAATQDIITDTYRIELLHEKSTGAGAAMESIGFRLGMLTSGAGTLYLAACLGWSAAYCVTALTGTLGVLAILMLKDPPLENTKQEIKAKTKQPLNLLNSFYQTYSNSWKHLLKKPYFPYLLMFIFCFKMGDTVLNSMSTPFLYELGFSKIEYANISKFFGISMMVSGGLIGGILIHQLGITQTLVMCATLQTLSCLMFMIQAQVGHVLSALIITIAVESFCSGLCSTAFIAYLSKFCKSPFTASQFTLLYSVGSLSRVLISTGSGWVADTYGWMILFFLSSLFSIPILYLVVKIKHQQRHPSITPSHQKNK